MIKNNLTNSNFSSQIDNKYERVLATLRVASKKIAQVWPLERFVAVNPYLGLTEKSFENVAIDLAVAGGIQMTLPSSFYLQKINEGKIKFEDIAKRTSHLDSSKSREKSLYCLETGGAGRSYPGIDRT